MFSLSFLVPSSLAGFFPQYRGLAYFLFFIFCFTISLLAPLNIIVVGGEGRWRRRRERRAATTFSICQSKNCYFFLSLPALADFFTFHFARGNLTCLKLTFPLSLFLLRVAFFSSPFSASSSLVPRVSRSIFSPRGFIFFLFRWVALSRKIARR